MILSSQLDIECNRISRRPGILLHPIWHAILLLLLIWQISFDIYLHRKTPSFPSLPAQLQELDKTKFYYLLWQKTRFHQFYLLPTSPWLPRLRCGSDMSVRICLNLLGMSTAIYTTSKRSRSLDFFSPHWLIWTCCGEMFFFLLKIISPVEY